MKRRIFRLWHRTGAGLRENGRRLPWGLGDHQRELADAEQHPQLHLGEFTGTEEMESDFQEWQKKTQFDLLPQVSLSIKFLNPFITLMLPSILIVLADIVSFALPLGGGERNSFKVTLVLSFTMFLIILNNELPGDSQCSPIIRQSAATRTRWPHARVQRSVILCLCCRDPLLHLPDLPGGEHVAVHDRDAHGQRGRTQVLLLQQRDRIASGGSGRRWEASS